MKMGCWYLPGITTLSEAFVVNKTVAIAPIGMTQIVKGISESPFGT